MEGMIHISKLNPVRLMEVGNKYHVAFANSIPAFLPGTEYCQPFENMDLIRLQVADDSYPYDYTASIIDVSGIEIKVFETNYKGQLGDLYYYNIEAALTGINQGVYFIQLTADGALEQKHFISEPIHIASKHESSALIKYSHDQNEFGICFLAAGETTPEQFSIRVHGGIDPTGFKPGSNDVIYTNQDNQRVLLNSAPYNVELLKLGNGKGLPNWIVEKLNRIFSTVEIYINGIRYIKFDSAKFEPVRVDEYPMAGWTLEVIRADEGYSDKYGAGDFNKDFNNDFNNQVAL